MISSTSQWRFQLLVRVTKRNHASQPNLRRICPPPLECVTSCGETRVVGRKRTVNPPRSGSHWRKKPRSGFLRSDRQRRPRRVSCRVPSCRKIGERWKTEETSRQSCSWLTRGIGKSWQAAARIRKRKPKDFQESHSLRQFSLRSYGGARWASGPNRLSPIGARSSPAGLDAASIHLIVRCVVAFWEALSLKAASVTIH